MFSLLMTLKMRVLGRTPLMSSLSVLVAVGLLPGAPRMETLEVGGVVLEATHKGITEPSLTQTAESTVLMSQ